MLETAFPAGWHADLLYVNVVGVERVSGRSGTEGMELQRVELTR
jgi:hypothetical protein